MTDIDIVDELRAALTKRQKEMKGGGALYRRAADEIERLRGEIEWEYSIGYSCIDLKGNRFWTDDGLGVMDRETAEAELRENRNSYLEDDCLVRRRKAGPWERVEGGSAR